MKTITTRLLVGLCAVGLISTATAQRFNKNKDILIAQFDSKPDPDDIHSIAALGCLLAHPDFAGVKYYAVAGAVGLDNGGKYIPAPALFNMAFGAKNTNWTDAFGNSTSTANQGLRNASITRIKNKVKPILQAGGKAFVQEAGSSTLTQDWVNALRADGISNSVLKNNIVVVQHSNWNEDRMDRGSSGWPRNDSRRVNLNRIKSNITYNKIGDGNGSGNGTPSYRVTNTGFRNSAEAGNNPNTKARNIWREADRVIQANGHLPSHSSITNGGVDFSDCVENWWIFQLGNNANSVQKFWNRYVTNSNSNQGNPASPAPTGGGGGGNPPTGGGGGGNIPQVGTVISLQGSNGQFVSSENGTQSMNCNRNSVSNVEKFTVVNAGGGKIALRANNGQFVSSENGNRSMNCNRGAIGAWEGFTVTATGTKEIALKGNNNRYVSSEHGRRAMNCNRSVIGGWEKFKWKAE